MNSKKNKKIIQSSAAAIKRAQLTQKWWLAYHELYSKINDLGAYMQSMRDDMERLRELSLEMGDLVQKNETNPAPKQKKSK